MDLDAMIEEAKGDFEKEFGLWREGVAGPDDFGWTPEQLAEAKRREREECKY